MHECMKFLIFVLQIIYSEGVCKLEISEVYPEDEGSYACVASNDAGEAKTTAKMFVKGKREMYNAVECFSWKEVIN